MQYQYMYTRTRAHTHTYTHTHAHKHMHTQPCTHTCTHPRTHIHTHTRTHTHAHSTTHTNTMHTHIRTHTLTYTHLFDDLAFLWRELLRFYTLGWAMRSITRCAMPPNFFRARPALNRAIVIRMILADTLTVSYSQELRRHARGARNIFEETAHTTGGLHVVAGQACSCKSGLSDVHGEKC